MTKEKKDDGGADNKRAEVKGGHLHTMLTSLADVQSGIDYGELMEDDEFTWNQFNIKVWGAPNFEVHASVAVPLTWLLLNSKLTMDLIANQKIMVNIR